MAEEEKPATGANLPEWHLVLEHTPATSRNRLAGQYAIGGVVFGTLGLLALILIGLEGLFFAAVFLLFGVAFRVCFCVARKRARKMARFAQEMSFAYRVYVPRDTMNRLALVPLLEQIGGTADNVMWGCVAGLHVIMMDLTIFSGWSRTGGLGGGRLSLTTTVVVFVDLPRHLPTFRLVPRWGILNTPWERLAFG